jgi:hypothetical protein
MLFLNKTSPGVKFQASYLVVLFAGWLLPFVVFQPAQIRGQSQAGPLKLLISIEQPTITAPLPARLTLNLHNAGNQTLWLFRKVRAPRAAAPRIEEENQAPETSGGSTLVVKLEPAEAKQSESEATPARGTVLESVGLPKPKLVRLGPGDDYEEKVTLHLEPARSGTNPSADGPGSEGNPVWGRYHLSVLYRASFSSAEEIQRNFGTTLWQGEVASNTIDIDFLSPSADGSVAGSVILADSTPIMDACVSLSDQNERLIDQTHTDAEGRFSFTHLPRRLYWVTARRERATEDVATFQHVELTAAQPAGTLQLVMLPAEIFDPQKILHKPVLFLITDSAGRPLDKVQLEITFSNGPVLDNVKAETGGEGLAAVELIPGRNFVTLKRRKCPKQEERADVATGEGVDDFKFVFGCSKE